MVDILLDADALDELHRWSEMPEAKENQAVMKVAKWCEHVMSSHFFIRPNKNAKLCIFTQECTMCKVVEICCHSFTT